ncbi:LysE family translocator [Devosia sp. YR412]|uniref:LysE family translocator n=1 Tax=Devosia sp. YR412 TaxID=1881030 RepID=UPI001AECC2E4|nr:LysE family translocator [Devosia sp. YR412]
MLFVITPGADWAYAITAGLSDRATVPAVTGLLSGHLLATLVVAAGAGVFIANVPYAITVISLAGAFYLVWLGIGLVINPPMPASGNNGQSSSIGWTLKGFGISGLNPKVFLLFVAVLPQFVRPGDAWPEWLQMSVLGVVHVVNCAIVYLAASFSSRSVLKSRPHTARVVGRVSGVSMIVIASYLAIERLIL